MRQGSLLCSDFHALSLSQQGRHTQGIHHWKSKGRPKSLPSHLEKDPFVGTPEPREILLLLAPSPISQPQEGKQRPGPIPQQIFDFSFTALRRNQGETYETWAAASCFSQKDCNSCKNRDPEVSTLPSHNSMLGWWPLISFPLRPQCGKEGACLGKAASLKEWVSRPGLFTWREADLQGHRWMRGWVGATHELFTFRCRN